MSSGGARGPEGGEPAAGPDDAAGVSAEPVTRGKRPLWLAALAALVTFVALYGAYAQQRPDPVGSDSPESPGGLFQQAQAAGTSLTAVGRTSGLAERCTAWLLDSGAGDDAQAYAVTTARCVGQTSTASVMSDQAIQGAAIEFNAFATLTTAKQPDLVKAPIEAVEWASSRGNDLAVLRLGATYGELSGRGVRPIDPVAPLQQGSEILVAGVPVEGIEPREQYLRGSRCQVGLTTDVVEGTWLWHDSQASDCSGILGGSWGSPVLNPAGEAVAMVNTTTIGADPGAVCADGVPCQVSADGVVPVAEAATYMVPVAALAACFPQGGFALGGQCTLEDPTSVVPAEATADVAPAGSTVEIRLEGELPEGIESTADIEVKQGLLGAADCRAPEGWLGAGGTAAESVDPAPEQWVHPVVLPPQEGFTLVCVGSPEHPTEIVIRAAGTAPDPGASN